MSRPTVLAGGGALWRGNPLDPEVAVVHRPRYDDWSLPKGKAKPGEHLLVTAIREVSEETGHVPRIGPYLSTVRYRVSNGRGRANKVVTYWAMRCVNGSFQPNREVDALEWMPLDDAHHRLTSPNDRRVLEMLSRRNSNTEPLLLIRHAFTASAARRQIKPPAEPRLTSAGRGQAAALVPVLAGLGITGLISADVPACTETLAPYAEAARVPVHVDALLTPNVFQENEKAAADRVRRHATSGPLAVCGPHRVVGGLLHALGRWAPAGPPDDTSVRRGGWWLLHHRDGEITACERHELAARVVPPGSGRS